MKLELIICTNWTLFLTGAPHCTCFTHIHGWFHGKSKTLSSALASKQIMFFLAILRGKNNLTVRGSVDLDTGTQHFSILSATQLDGMTPWFHHVLIFGARCHPRFFLNGSKPPGEPRRVHNMTDMTRTQTSKAQDLCLISDTFTVFDHFEPFPISVLITKLGTAWPVTKQFYDSDATAQQPRIINVGQRRFGGKKAWEIYSQICGLNLYRVSKVSEINIHHNWKENNFFHHASSWQCWSDVFSSADRSQVRSLYKGRSIVNPIAILTSSTSHGH